MRRIMWNVLKVMLMFFICLMMFFYGLRLMHHEYEQFHRYDPPAGPAIQVDRPLESSILRYFIRFFIEENNHVKTRD